MAKIPKKNIKQIRLLISSVLSLNNVEEFRDCSYEDAPEFWTDEEKRMCDYQGRIINELLDGLEKILNVSFGDTERGRKHERI
jgi:hypothetical protein